MEKPGGLGSGALQVLKGQAEKEQQAIETEKV